MMTAKPPMGAGTGTAIGLAHEAALKLREAAPTGTGAPLAAGSIT